jgi:hypothetical protein
VLRRPGTRACPGRLGLGKYTAARRRAGPSSESQCSRVAFSGRPSALAGNLLCFRRCFSCFASRFLCTGAQGQTCARLTEDTLSARSTLPRRRTRANSRPDAVVIVEGKGPRLLLLRIRIWVPHFRRGRVRKLTLRDGQKSGRTKRDARSPSSSTRQQLASRGDQLQSSAPGRHV